MADSGLKPMEAPQSASWHQPISSDDYKKLQPGYDPDQMEIKWRIRSQAADSTSGRGSVHIYRSWTGYEDLRGDYSLTPGKESYAVFDKISWETSQERRNGSEDAASAKELFVSLLNGLLDLDLKPSS